jgi:aminoglycoside phosphotransferase
VDEFGARLLKSSNTNLAKTIALSHYGESATARNVGWGNNEIWTIDHATGTDYLKIYLTGRESCEREVWALLNLGNTLPVPRVIDSSISTSCPLYILTEGIPGQPLDKVKNDRAELIKQMGCLVARLHSFDLTASSLPSHIENMPTLEGFIDFHTMVANSEVANFISESSIKTAINVQCSPKHPVLSQRDCGDWQCIVNEGRIEGILDWEAIGLSDPEVDLALAGAFFQAFRGADEENIFLNAYASEAAHSIRRNVYMALKNCNLLTLHEMWKARGQKPEADAAKNTLIYNSSLNTTDAEQCAQPDAFGAG